MLKWPNVPDCYGWLGLDARGNWYMRDDRAQHTGSFQCGLPEAKGSLLVHEKLIAFIQRNYAADVQGRWYFQNGPQRVYVELESTPWIWRLVDDGRIEAHDGRSATLKEVLLDELGWLYLNTDLGLGTVHTQDVGRAADWIEAGIWPEPQDVVRRDLPAQFGFVISPKTLATSQSPAAPPQT